MSAAGLAKAPTSKGVLAFTTLSTLAASAYKVSSRLGLTLEALLSRREVWRVFTYHCAFSTAGELVLGLVLLYTFRQFERQWGWRRFGSFLFLSSSLSSLIGIGLLALLRHHPSQLAGGPYGLIFASLVQYYFDIPTVNQVQVFGLNVSPKAVTYLMAFQLAMAAPGSALASISGIIAGLAYRSKALNLRSFALPRPVCNAFATVFLPFLESPPSANPGGRDRQAHRDGGFGRQQQPGGMPPGVPMPGDARIPAWAMQNLHHRPQQAPRPVSEEAMTMLAGMGFVDRARNERLLNMYHGDVQHVIEELIAGRE